MGMQSGNMNVAYNNGNYLGLNFSSLRTKGTNERIGFGFEI